jgi:hypothetical protein
MNFKYFLIFLVIISCKSQNSTLFEFDPRNLKQSVLTLSEIADSIGYLPLNNSFQLGLIYDNIRFIKDNIYISDKDIGILSFNVEGNMYRKIGNKGRGPGEYIFNYLFTVDEKTETVYILDSGDIIKAFSNNGRFLRRFSLEEYGDMIDAIDVYNSNLFVLYEIQNKNVKYKWVIVDSLGNLIKKEKRKIPEFTSSVGGSSGTYSFRNKISYWNGYFSDTIFSISSDLNEQPSFIISQGEHRFPKSRIIFPNEITQYLLIHQIFESNRFWAIRYSYRNRNEFGLIDKEVRKTFLANWEYDGRGGILNDFDGGTRFLPKDYFKKFNREYLVGLIYPFWIKSHILSNEFKISTPKYPEKKKELEKLANSLKETDNPVLMIVRLKK